MVGAMLPPGFRFHPTDEELVGYYLKRKFEGLVIELEVIPVIDCINLIRGGCQEVEGIMVGHHVGTQFEKVEEITVGHHIGTQESVAKLNSHPSYTGHSMWPNMMLHNMPPNLAQDGSIFPFFPPLCPI